MTTVSELGDTQLFGMLPDEKARDELLVRHRPLARYIAR